MFYYKLAADRENVDAICSYADLIFDEDKKTAFECYKDACGLYKYGLMLYNGDIDTKKINKEEAIKYIKNAADKGRIEAMIFCGDYLRTEKGTVKYMRKAAKYYKLTADKGNILGTFIYSCINYANNFMDSEESIKYIKKAADEGTCVYYLMKKNFLVEKKQLTIIN